MIFIFSLINTLVTICSDPGKLLILEQILKVIQRDNLLANVNKVGTKLKAGLLDAQNEFPQLLNSTRGRGTFLAINCANSILRDDLVGRLRAKGIDTALNSIRSDLLTSFI